MLQVPERKLFVRCARSPAATRPRGSGAPTSETRDPMCVLTETDKHASSPPLVPYVSAGWGREAERSVPLVGPTCLSTRDRDTDAFAS